MAQDILAEFAGRLEITLRALNAAPEAVYLSVRQVEKEIRQQYGGERVYVGKTNKAKFIAAKAAVDRGTPVKVAAAKNGISRGHLYELIRRK